MLDSCWTFIHSLLCRSMPGGSRYQGRTTMNFWEKLQRKQSHIPGLSWRTCSTKRPSSRYAIFFRECDLSHSKLGYETDTQVQRTLDTTNPFLPYQIVRCIQGFVVKDAISIEFVRVVPIAKVRCMQEFVV